MSAPHDCRQCGTPTEATDLCFACSPESLERTVKCAACFAMVKRRGLASHAGSVPCKATALRNRCVMNGLAPVRALSHATMLRECGVFVHLYSTSYARGASVPQAWANAEAVLIVTGGESMETRRARLADWLARPKRIVETFPPGGLRHEGQS